MKAVGYRVPGPAKVLEDIELPKPSLTGARDLLVRVEAVSVNPVDTKIRTRSGAFEGDHYRVLGWDVAGVVEEAGEASSFYRAGDRVFYSGALMRPGGNAEYHVVDERLVGPMPRTLDWGQAAALPLTAVTAWEMLFDRMKIDASSKGHLLIIGGAGGVGSIMIQLARKLTGLSVIATASRPETHEWVHRMGAHHVINHRTSMQEQLGALNIRGVDYIASLTASDAHHAALSELVAPQGHISLIDDPASFDIMPFKRKSVTISWEFMYTRSMFQTGDMDTQHTILEKVSHMVDAGDLVTTETRRVGPINAATMRELHEASESGTSIGKSVAIGF